MTVATTVNSLCAYCGVGCGMTMQIDGTPGAPVIAKTIGRKEHPTNFGRLCTKGSTTADMLNAGGRLDRPLVRTERGAQQQPGDMDEVITDTARRLRAIIDEHGPDAVALYVSGQMSLEAQYLTNKLAKGFIGTNQIESNSRLCMASAGTGYKQSLGSDAPPGSYQDFDHADVFFVIGANMADCHPILFLRMMDRVKAGAKLIVVDPRRNATADKADLFLQVKGGTDLALLNGLLHLLIEAGHTDADFIAEFTDGFAQMPDFAAQYTPESVAEITGVAEADLRQAAEMIGTAGNWMSCWTMGLNQSTHGTWNTNALVNLHLATGAICRLGSGPFSLTGQPNAMGGREMGYMGPGLPGQRAVISDDDRAFVEEKWGLEAGTLHTRLGGGTIDMFSRMADGEIKACWIICTNPVATVANRKTVIQGLERAELVITQDTFADAETNQYADVVLPAALWTESSGVFINSERNLTLFEPAVPAPGQALPDWQIIARVASEMGYADAFDYASAEEIFTEIKGFANPRTGYDIRGVTYDGLRVTPMQWPCPPASANRPDPTADGARNPIRYLNDGVSQTLHTLPDGTIPRLAFATPTRRAQFFARPHIEPAEMPDDDYPILLNTGRLAHQWHTMTKTGKVAKLNKLNPGPFVEIHPDDAARLGIADDDQVEVASRRGHAVLPASVSDRVRPGNCFVPFHWNDSFGEHLAINAVTSDAIDAASQQPEFKVCAVTLTKVAVPETDSTAAQPGDGQPTSSQRWSSELLDLLAHQLGVGNVTAPQPDDAERIYLAGLVAGVAANPTGVPALPPDAPLRPEIRGWVAGLLAGMFARSETIGGGIALPAGPVGLGPAVGDATVIDAETETIIVAWASQTGNAEEFAADVVERVKSTGREAISRSMDEIDVKELSGSTALFVTSTTGDGDPPDNGSSFWDVLNSGEAPDLSGVNYAVLAFGDSNYDDFCGHGRKLDERIGALGGRRIADRAECEPDFEDTAGGWLDSVIVAMSTKAPTSEVIEDRAIVVSEPADSAAAPSVREATAYSRKNPYVTKLTRNVRLSAEGSQKDVRNFAFHLPYERLSYTAGDALGVWPLNNQSLIDEWLSATGLPADAPVTVGGDAMTLRRALRERLDFARTTADFMRFVAERHDDPELTALVTPGNKEKLNDWMWGRQTVDVLADFPVAASVEEWLGVIKPLTPRQYSISSSPLERPDEVQLTVSTVRYNDFGTERGGVCSTFLADHADDEQDIGVFVSTSTHFGPPADPDAPIIMIGPGTGIAPFRGFLRDREARGHGGKNWLFFGEQYSATDFYYRDELTSMLSDGLLTRLDVAFSRDQDHKIYVQDRMVEHGKELYQWLHDGAYVYVCGDASRMAKDVDAALKGIVAQYGRRSPKSADAYVKALAADKRYVRDVY
ncbi:bifunctional nitrate reductase/sulfite reductase flavoprotein subunit alpha [Gordonia sp. ABSL1-1]|uniref:bifunctional nitrate reductase/sulfite reductase flavoprotein subunit alpha n=1 Tax=Gordonia sp. ABSL1-1 TaxID=3053923 RepID=UPI0025730812|nr:bifunctional nitrate reductase/sulfite reductase flavoprotein subunit alpha [Gordonia sp. ABSL1-1]MDL9938969.1 bifunctional nitrate reductase/sulfite reductase flavoprotein subunit alpha [Gordonia sp. ABSL1-1]